MLINYLQIPANIDRLRIPSILSESIKLNENKLGK